MIDVMGTPDRKGDPNQTLPPGFEGADTTGLYLDYIAYFTDLNGFNNVMLTFQFYHYNSIHLNKFYGLERIVLTYEGSQKQCKEFQADIRPAFDAIYGEADFDMPELNRVAWDGNDDGYPDVSFIMFSRGKDNYYSEISFSKHTQYKQIADKENEDAYFKTIKRGVSLENYNKISEGMAYETVIRYLGYGEKTSESKIGGSTYTYFEWYGKNNAVIRIQFKDNKVSLIHLKGNL